MDLTKFGVEVKVDKPQEINSENVSINLDEISKEYIREDKEFYLPWFLKYKLKKFDDIIKTENIKKIEKFIEEFKPGKGLLLYGRAGSGKTTTLNLLAEKYGYELFELNASDSRNKKTIEASVGEIIKQKSLFAKEKLILIDEVDGVSGTKDRGGVAQLIKIVRVSNYPICFSANNAEADSIKALKKVCININFENDSYELLFGIGERILKKEKIKFNDEDLKKFIEVRDSVDIRGFINDLQASVIGGEFCFDDENLEIREYKKKIETLLDNIFYSYPEDSLKKSFNTDINLDDLFLYLEENAPNVYSRLALVKAFNEIGKADVFRGRILKWQYYRFLVYVNFYLTYGVSSSKDDNVQKSKYKRNSRILKKWIYSNKVNAIRDRTKVEKKKYEDLRFIEIVAQYYKRSVKKVRSDDIFYFAFMYKNDDVFKSWAEKEFQIDKSIEKVLLELV